MKKQTTTRAGGAFFEYLGLTNFYLPKYGLFKIIDRNSYKHNCSCLALAAGGVSDVKLQIDINIKESNDS